jgi:hypothetical protein
MLASLRWLAAPALLAGLVGLLVPADAGADGPPDGFRVKDGAKLFSKAAMDKAEKTIAKIKHDYKQDLLVETYAEIPEGLRAKYKEESKEKFFHNWGAQRYNQAGVSGVLILISKEPTYIRVEEGKQTGKRAFTDADAKAVSTLLADHFRKKDFDGGLQAAVEYVDTTMRRHLGKSASGSPTAGVTNTTKELEKEASSMSPLGWICLGLGALLVLWLVVGMFRAMSGAGQQMSRPGGNYAQGGPGNYGPGGPPPGYAPQGYGGGYGGGGGGGGFFKGMLGGMLGGAAGAWAYDRFFRGDSGYGGGGMTPPAYGGGATTPDNSAGGGAGADWGSSTPADTGGGGADWGGGGDTGGADYGGGGGDTGGADWGGGGGDSGGGADWGGGGGDTGGGDWGGGGGDSGGGSDW